MNKTTRGIFIVLEGVDGAGKSTQLQLLQETFTKMGYDVVASREPTDGKWGRKIRASATQGRMPLDEELAAFVADRKEHIETLIGPELRQGKIVLVDRYFYSTIAYQGARGADKRTIDDTMRAFAPIPDFVILLDADPRLTLTRIAEGRGDIPDEFEGMETLQRVRATFSSLAETCPEIFSVDAQQSPQALHENILRVMLDEARRRGDSSMEDGPPCGYRVGAMPWQQLQRRLSDYLSRDEQDAARL